LSPADSSAKKPAKRRQKTPKAPPDIYTALLAIALVAIVLGIVCLYLNNDQVYDWDFTGGPRVSAGHFSTPALAGWQESPILDRESAAHRLPSFHV
jgi:hypothetical protein